MLKIKKIRKIFKKLKKEFKNQVKSVNTEEVFKSLKLVFSAKSFQNRGVLMAEVQSLLDSNLSSGVV